MDWFRRLRSKLFWLWRDRTLEAEMAEEMSAHLERLVAANRDAGMSSAEAREGALRQFGNVSSLRERARDERRFQWLEHLIQDLAYAGRQLRRNPTFAATAILSLALGIGANTAIFQLADAVRLRPLPVDHPEQLVEIRMADPTRGRMGTFAGRRPLFTNALWEDLRDRQRAFSGVVAWGAYPVNLSTRGAAQFAQGLWVSGDFFNVLGVTPHAGRLLSVSDDRHGCGAPGAVLGYDFWRRQFGGDAGAIGRTITLDGHSFEIIGVAPRRFVGLEVGRTFDVATPICAEAILNREHSALTDRSWWWLTVMGRLAPGSSIERASTELAALSPGIFENTVASGLPPEVSHAFLASTLKAFPAPTGVSGTVREEYERPLWVLLAIAGIVLIVASANIATLLLARAITQERDLSLRVALGAARGRLIRQLFTESALVAAMGAAAGFWLAQTLSKGLLGLLQATGFQFFGVTFTLDPNWRVLIFGTTMTFLTCLMFGLVPAIVATRPKAGILLRTAVRTSTPRIGIRGGFVVVQVALSVVLVVTALLFVRTLYNLTTANSGLDLGRVTAVVVDYQHAQIPAERRLELQSRLLDAVRSVPGVQSAASVRMVPLSGESWNGHVVIDGVQRQTETYFNRVSPAFFQTVGTTLIAGRDFGPDDALGSRRVAIVNESFAGQLLGARNPIGSTFQMPASPGATQPLIEIVGLVRDAKYTSLREPFNPTAFFPSTQERRPLEYVNLVVRAATSVAVDRSVADAIARIEPDTVVLLQPFQDVIGDALVRERLMATLSGFFGGVAAFLAILGLYGVVAYGVTERTREIGIRTALGAQPSQVVRLVLRQGAWLTVPGVAVGLALSVAATRLFRGLLFGLPPVDPMTFIGVAVTFAMVAALSAYLPARRATKVDPLIALRSE